jgi:hypothetical protein
MLAVRITLAHFSVYVAMNARNSAGELANTTPPRLGQQFAPSSWRRSPALHSALSLVPVDPQRHDDYPARDPGALASRCIAPGTGAGNPAPGEAGRQSLRNCGRGTDGGNGPSAQDGSASCVKARHRDHRIDRRPDSLATRSVRTVEPGASLEDSLLGGELWEGRGTYSCAQWHPLR